jgi:glutathione S-transferase
MATPILYGPSISTYVRAARLVLIEKNVEHELVEVDFFRGEHRQPAHLARHPFGKVPALEHDGFSLYETVAITRYLDAAFPEVPLTPSEPRQIGLMAQAIAVVDAYTYPALIGEVVIPRFFAAMRGAEPDEAAIHAATPRVELALGALDDMLEGSAWLSGGDLGLADLHLAPVMAAFVATPEGGVHLPRHANLQRWWGGVSTRASMAATEVRLG